MPISASGTTSSAEMLAPSAITPVVVPAKYRWWKVPRMPPAMNTMVANSTLTVAVRPRTSPSLTNRKLITATANTSKKPSTHRCTTHQRQYSTVDMWVFSFHISPAAYSKAMATVERNSSPTIEDISSLRRSAGHSARPISSNHSSRPTNRKICQKRPMSVYSQPWWPNQKLYSRPIFCITANHCPAKEPTTITSRQTNRKFTPRRWNLGSCPDTAGLMYRPVASHAVAIHSTASCVCQLRVSEYGRYCEISKP